MVGTFDMKDFFPSTTAGHVAPVLAAAGFCDAALADVLQLLTLNSYLPQGSPTSSLLANLAFIHADVKIRRAFRRHGFRYTRFVDDLAISGQNVRLLKGVVNNIVKGAGHKLAPLKTRFRTNHQRQIVTGLIVNEKLRPTKEFRTAIKRDVRLCRTLGPSVVADLNGVSIKRLRLKLLGRINHVGIFEPKEAEHLKRLLFYTVDWPRGIRKQSN
jgi:RNA-directed DNA polymerase